MARRSSVPNIPTGGCTPSRTVNVNATGPSQVVANTRVQLSGLSELEVVTTQCELDSTDLPFTWSLFFQPTGGAETNITSSLVDANTLTPSFVATGEGQFRASLRGGNTAAGFKTDNVTITALPPPPQLLNLTGHINFLRVHELGTGFGPPNDFIDTEAVVKLDVDKNKAFGFQLRNDRNRPAREGMLGLLRDAFNNNWTVSLDFFLVPGRSNGTVLRVALVK